MTTTILLGVIVVLLAINLFLWKSGFLFQAEDPHSVVDAPVANPKERRAFIKRLQRWKEEGRVSRGEFEHFEKLANSYWD